MFTVVWWGAGRLEEDAGGGGGSGVGLQRSEVRGFMRRAAGCSDRHGAPQQQLGCLSFALACVCV